jgi:hypothetical protein
MSGYKNNVEIVVARYNESLSWLDEYPFNQFEYIVYNKGDNNDFVKTNVKNIIKLNNVGRCDHTYLYHITENYNNLSNIVVFFPGSLNMENKKIKATMILNNIINSNYTNAYFIGNYYNSVREKYKNFELSHHKCGYSENYNKNQETILNRCKIRPYGMWYNYFFGNTPAHWVALSGVFSIDKKDIIQNSVNKYIVLKNIISNHSNPEAGHYIERSWGKIFYPLIYTKKKILKV